MSGIPDLGAWFPVRPPPRHTRCRSAGRSGASQAELAERVGGSRQTIIAVEQGDHAPSAHLALRIARTLGGTVEELFTDGTGADG